MRILIVLIFSLSQLAHANMRSPACLGKNKEKTLEKFYAIKRALMCRGSQNLFACNEALGLGVVGAALVAGGVAANKIRNPDFRFCPLKSADGFFLELGISEAEASACTDSRLMRRTLIEQSVAQAKLDLDVLENDIENRARTASSQMRVLEDYDNEMDNNQKALNQAWEKNSNWKEYSEWDAKRREIFFQMREPNITAEQRAKLKTDYDDVTKRVNELGRSINQDPNVKRVMDEGSLIAERRRGFIEGTLEPELKANPKAAQILTETEAQKVELRKARIKLTEISRINTPGASLRALQSASDELLDLGSTSAKQRELLGSLQFADSMDDSRSFREFSSTNKTGARFDYSKTRTAARFRVGSVIKNFSSKLGVAGVLVGVATASSASEIIPEAVESGLFVSRGACADFHMYFDYEIVEGGCQPVVELTSKSEPFFDLEEDQVEAAIAGNFKMCEFIDKTYNEFFPSSKSANCGRQNIFISRNDFKNDRIVLADNGAKISGVEFETDEGHLDLKLNSNGEIESLTRTYRPPQSNFSITRIGLKDDQVTKPLRQNDPYIYAYAQEELYKRMSAFLETKSCCSSDPGPRPTDIECQRLGVSVKPQAGAAGSPGPTTRGRGRQ